MKGSTTSVAEPAFLGELRDRLGHDAVLDEASDLVGYEQGWRYGRGKARCVVRPRTATEVASVLALARERALRVVPVGANTGLVGASNPDAQGDMLVLSTERLNERIEVDPVDGVVEVDAGVTLSRLNEALAAHGLWFPIDLGADPQVGGMVATNTGGTRLLRYGDVRANLLGLQVALPDGTVWSRLGRLYKDNTGLDWKQLFVGTGGSFGVVTRAVLRVVPRPRQRVAALACATSGAGVLSLLRALQGSVGELLSAFEVLSAPCVDAVRRHGVLERDPFEGDAPAYAVLLELSSTLATDVLDLERVLHDTLGQLFESESVEDVEDVLFGQAEDFWSVRHQVSESLREEGTVLALDLSVPRSRLAAFTDAVRTELASTHPFVRVCDFGHWGDGGTHLNLVWDAAHDGAPALRSDLQDRVYEICVHFYAGSYSAEHGVGPHNQAAYSRFTDAPTKAVCHALKTHFDSARRLGRVALDG